MRASESIVGGEADTPPVVWHREAWELLHRWLTVSILFATLAAAFHGRGDARWMPLSLWALLLLAAVSASQRYRYLLLDVVTDFRYREKLGLLLLHCVAPFVPRLFFGVRGWDHAFAALLCLQSLLLLRPNDYARLFTVAGLALVLGFLRQPAPPFVLGLSWLLLYLLASRAGHVRFLLERHHEERGPDLRMELRLLALPTAAALLIAASVRFAGAPFLSPLELRWHFSPPAQAPQQLGPVSIGSAVWNSILLVILIVVALALCAWIERKLRSWRRNKPSKELLEGGALVSAFADEALEPPPIVDDEPGPRRRIIQRFATFDHDLAAAGLSRQPTETAAHFSKRLDNAPEGQHLFDQACYSPLPMQVEDAERYEATLDRERERLRRATPTGAPEENLP